MQEANNVQKKISVTNRLSDGSNHIRKARRGALEKVELWLYTEMVSIAIAQPPWKGLRLTVQVHFFSYLSFVSSRMSFAGAVKKHSHIGVPGFKSWLCSQFQLSTNVHPERQHVTAQLFTSLSPTQGTQVEFWPLALANCCMYLGRNQWIDDLPASLLLSYSLIQIKTLKIQSKYIEFMKNMYYKRKPEDLKN